MRTEQKAGPPQDDVILEANGLTKVFGSGESAVRAIEDVVLEVHRGEIVLVMGPSGSGKTTLLTMIGGLLKPTSGAVRITRTRLGPGTPSIASKPFIIRFKSTCCN